MKLGAQVPLNGKFHPGQHAPKLLQQAFGYIQLVLGNHFFYESTDVPINDTTLVGGNAQFRDFDVQQNGIDFEANCCPKDGWKTMGMLSLGNWMDAKNFDMTIFNDLPNEMG